MYPYTNITLANTIWCWKISRRNEEALPRKIMLFGHLIVIREVGVEPKTVQHSHASIIFTTLFFCFFVCHYWNPFNNSEAVNNTLLMMKSYLKQWKDFTCKMSHTFFVVVFFFFFLSCKPFYEHCRRKVWLKQTEMERRPLQTKDKPKFGKLHKKVGNQFHLL